MDGITPIDTTNNSYTKTVRDYSELDQVLESALEPKKNITLNQFGLPGFPKQNFPKSSDPQIKEELVNGFNQHDISSSKRGLEKSFGQELSTEAMNKLFQSLDPNLSGSQARGLLGMILESEKDSLLSTKTPEQAFALINKLAPELKKEGFEDFASPYSSFNLKRLEALDSLIPGSEKKDSNQRIQDSLSLYNALGNDQKKMIISESFSKFAQEQGFLGEGKTPKELATNFNKYTNILSEGLPNKNALGTYKSLISSNQGLMELISKDDTYKQLNTPQERAEGINSVLKNLTRDVNYRQLKSILSDSRFAGASSLSEKATQARAYIDSFSDIKDDKSLSQLLTSLNPEHQFTNNFLVKKDGNILDTIVAFKSFQQKLDPNNDNFKSTLNNFKELSTLTLLESMDNLDSKVNAIKKIHDSLGTIINFNGHDTTYRGQTKTEQEISFSDRYLLENLLGSSKFPETTNLDEKLNTIKDFINKSGNQLSLNDKANLLGTMPAETVAQISTAFTEEIHSKVNEESENRYGPPLSPADNLRSINLTLTHNKELLKNFKDFDSRLSAYKEFSNSLGSEISLQDKASLVRLHENSFFKTEENWSNNSQKIANFQAQLGLNGDETKTAFDSMRQLGLIETNTKFEDSVDLTKQTLDLFSSDSNPTTSLGLISGTNYLQGLSSKEEKFQAIKDLQEVFQQNTNKFSAYDIRYMMNSLSDNPNLVSKGDTVKDIASKIYNKVSEYPIDIFKDSFYSNSEKGGRIAELIGQGYSPQQVSDYFNSVKKFDADINTRLLTHGVDADFANKTQLDPKNNQQFDQIVDNFNRAKILAKLEERLGDKQKAENFLNTMMQKSNLGNLSYARYEDYLKSFINVAKLEKDPDRLLLKSDGSQAKGNVLFGIPDYDGDNAFEHIGSKIRKLNEAGFETFIFGFKAGGTGADAQFADFAEKISQNTTGDLIRPFVNITGSGHGSNEGFQLNDVARQTQNSDENNWDISDTDLVDRLVNTMDPKGSSLIYNSCSTCEGITDNRTTLGGIAASRLKPNMYFQGARTPTYGYPNLVIKDNIPFFRFDLERIISK